MIKKTKSPKEKAIKLPTSGKLYMVQSAYAEARGVTGPRITALIKKGIIILEPGIHKGRKHNLVNVKKADKAVAENQDPSRNDYRNFAGGEPPPERPHEENPEMDGKTYKQAITKKERAKAALAELELEQKKGRLVDIDEFKKLYIPHIASTKTRIRAIPSRVSQEIVHAIKNNLKSTDRLLIVAVQNILTKDIDEVLENLADGS